jgi:integrase
MHGQDIDDVGPIVASPIAMAHQLRGDRLAVGLVSNQHVAEVFASRGVQGPEQVPEVGVLVEEVRRSDRDHSRRTSAATRNACRSGPRSRTWGSACRLVKRADLPRITLHQVRHSCRDDRARAGCRRALRLGAPRPLQRCDHQAVYQHSRPERVRDAVNTISKAIGG